MSEGSTVDPAASAPEHSPAEDGEPPSNGDANDSANYGIDKLHRNSSVDVFRTCADPGIYYVYICTVLCENLLTHMACINQMYIHVNVHVHTCTYM